MVSIAARDILSQHDLAIFLNLFCDHEVLPTYLCGNVGLTLDEAETRCVSAEGIGGEVEEPQGDGQVVEQVLPLPRPVLRFMQVTSAAQRTRHDVLS